MGQGREQGGIDDCNLPQRAESRGERSEVGGQRNFYPDEDMVKQTLNVSRKGAKVKK